MAVRCGDCKNFTLLNDDTGEGLCSVIPEKNVLDFTVKNQRKGCKFEDKHNHDHIDNPFGYTSEES